MFRWDGTVLGSIPLSQLGAGAHGVAWNGRLGPTRLPDGRYLLGLSAWRRTTFYDPSPVFLGGAFASYGVTIDTVAPVVASASSSSSLISPNGDGIRDGVTLKLAATGAASWTFSAAPISGTTVGAPVATGSGPGHSVTLAWIGRNNTGGRVADGLYRLTLAAIDTAGNRAARAWTVRVDDTPATIPTSVTPAPSRPMATARTT